MTVARKIIDAGFDLKAEGGKLIVRPADQLTSEQCRFIRQHKAEILAELQSATIHDLDRHAHEKQAATRYWRFLHSGIETDIASGATVSEAADLLRVGSDDVLEPIIEHDSDDVPVSLSTPSMPGWQETTLRMWLHQIEETGPEIIAETINKCHTDIDAREFFLDRARKSLSEAGKAVTCGDCEHFQPDKIGDGTGIGSCQAGAWTPGRGPCLYPNAKRFCNEFKQREVTA